MSKRHKITLLWLMLLLLAGNPASGMSDLQITTQISDQISTHEAAMFKLFGVVVSAGVLMLGWVFKLNIDNRRLILQAEEKFNQHYKEVLNLIQKENHEFLLMTQEKNSAIERQLIKNCEAVNHKIEKHMLHVANNYMPHEKIERMLEKNQKDIEHRFEILQTTVNNLIITLKNKEI